MKSKAMLQVTYLFKLIIILVTSVILQYITMADIGCPLGSFLSRHVPGHKPCVQCPDDCSKEAPVDVDNCTESCKKKISPTPSTTTLSMFHTTSTRNSIIQSSNVNINATEKSTAILPYSEEISPTPSTTTSSMFHTTSTRNSIIQSSTVSINATAKSTAILPYSEGTATTSDSLSMSLVIIIIILSIIGLVLVISLVVILRVFYTKQGNTNHGDDDTNAEQRPNAGTIEMQEFAPRRPNNLVVINNEPASNKPPTNEPASNEPPTNEPASNEPPTNEPASNEPPTNEPASNEPPTNEPASNELASNEPASNEPASPPDSPQEIDPLVWPIPNHATRETDEDFPYLNPTKKNSSPYSSQNLLDRLDKAET